MKRISFGTLVCALCFVFAATTACKKDAPTSGGDIVPVIPPDPTVPTPGEVDAAGGFNVKMNPPKGANYYIHKDGDFDEMCVVEEDAATLDRQIDCIAEVEELEGKYHGLQFVVNVPPNMCRYYTYAPYYYFGYPYGDADGAIVRVDLNSSNEFVSQSVVSGADVSVGSSQGKFNCAFDHTLIGGPNCCEGNYTFRTYVNGVLSASEDRAWGGKIGNCTAGAGMTAPRDKVHNLPMPTISFSADGASKAFDVAKTIDMANAHTIYFANYLTSTPLPDAMVGGNRYYEWTCYDDAMDQQAQIRIQVREWNESEEFLLKSLGDPDSSGSELLTGPWDDYNDWPDWDDWKNADPTAYPGIPQ